jgi:acetyl coenzyme A synthetase (ADP forming)-like protein
MRANVPDIKYLFEPRSVAVIGASQDTTKLGFHVTDNIISGGYEGSVYPINPRGGEICGRRAYKSIEDVDDEVDLVSIVVPAKFVYEAVQSCARKKAKFVSIITSGFAEVGKVEEEQKIVACARENGMRIQGPNIFGIYSCASSLNATFSSGCPEPGSVAIITQSGALGLGMIGKTAIEHLGLSCIVSVGNKSDLDEADLLEYLIPQEQTRLIFIYIEGVQDGRKLIKVLSAATKKKPVIVLKSGRSERGAIAAASHTGSLAGADDVFDAIMRQCGVLRAECVKEGFDWCKFIAHTPAPAGENTVIITNGGGIGVMASDASEKYSVSLYDDAAVLKEAFTAVTPDFGSTKNPVDVTGQAGPKEYNLSLDTAFRHPDMHAVMSLYCETAVFDADSLYTMITENTRKYRAGQKPLVFAVFGGRKAEDCIVRCREQSIPVFSEVYEAVSCLGALYRYNKYRNNTSEGAASVKLDIKSIEEVARRAVQQNRFFLLANEAQTIMKIAGMEVPKSSVARNLDEAVRCSENIGYPVVMKVVSKDIIHKSDAGGVALDLENRNEVIDAYQAIMHSCKAYNPSAFIEGVEIAEMVRPGTELIIGARRDATFGSIVMAGLGGIDVEVMKDVTFRSFPLDRKEVMNMIKEIRSYPLLLGVRGEEKKDIDGVADIIITLGSLIEDCPLISDIEVNPLRVYEGRGVKAVDVRILLSKVERSTKHE